MNRAIAERTDHAPPAPLRAGEECAGVRQPPAYPSRRAMAAIGGRVHQVLRGTTFAAIVDQAFYSGTTFLTSVLLGSFAGAHALGVYALAFSIAVLVMCAHETLLTTPYTILIHRHRDARQQRLAGSLLVQCLGLSGLAAAGLLIAAAVMAALRLELEVTVEMLTLACVVPLMLLRELARKIAYAHLRMGQAMGVDAGVCLLQLSLLAMLAAAGRLTAVTAFLAIGAACGVAGGLWVCAAWRTMRIRRRQIATDLLRNWRLGRWICAALVTFMLQTSILLWLIAFTLGETSSGIFAACLTVIALANPLVGAIGGLFTPQASRALHMEGCGEVRRIALHRTALLAALTGAFSLAVVLFGGDFLRLVYGPEYAAFPWMIAMLGIAVCAKAVESIAYNGLFVLQRAQVNLWINAANLVLLALAAPILLTRFGLPGAAAAMLLTAIVGTALRWFAFISLLNVRERVSLAAT